LRQSLISAGEDAARVAAIVAPAGEPIGAKTPEEIALSVLATVVAARRGRVASPASPPAAAPTTTPVASAAPAASAEPAKSCCGGM
jgi:xanthine dehydrogenase accessory factor